jgi:HK97 family phage prohead protease/HK97 family phage major capsid protein
MPDIIRKTLVNSGSDPNEYIMSDETVDRFGDVIEAAGWDLKWFKKNPIALFGHSSSFIVGHWTDVRIEGKSLIGKLHLLADHISPRIAEVAALIKAGVLRAVSVGFKPKDYEWIKDASGNETGGIRFKSTELVECSLVAVGANPNALQVAKSLSLSSETRSLILAEPGNLDEISRRGLVGGRARITQRNVKMTLAERIQAAQQRLVAAKDRLTEHINKSVDGEDPTDEFTTAQEELTNSVNAAQKALDTLKNAEKALGTTAQEPDEPQSPTIHRDIANRAPFNVKRKKPDPKDFMYRSLAAGLLAHIEKKPRDLVMRERYGDDSATRAVMDLVFRAATVPATTTLTGWAAELVMTTVLDFLEDLMPQSVYPGLSAKGGRFTFGRAGVVSLPSRAATPTIGGSFVAQGSPIPVRQAGYQSISLTPKKMGVISTFTREIAEHSTPSIEALIRQAIQEDTSVAIDAVLLDNTAASTTRPAGLRNGVSGLTPTTGGGFAALVGDIKQMVAVLVAANSLRAPVWIMNPAQVLSIAMTQNAGGDFPFAAEVNQGRLQGYPILQSTSMVAARVLLVDAADFFSATGDEPRFDVSDQAVLHMEDTAPTAIGTAGTPTVVAAPVRSLWQTDSIGIRMLLDINWAMRRAGLIAWIDSVTW